MTLLTAWLTVTTLSLGLLTATIPREHRRATLHNAAALLSTLDLLAYLLTR